MSRLTTTGNREDRYSRPEATTLCLPRLWPDVCRDHWDAVLPAEEGQGGGYVEEKFAEYAQAGISEYWLVDHAAYTIEVFVLRNGAYTLLVKAGPGEKAYSEVLKGFEIFVDEAFAR